MNYIIFDLEWNQPAEENATVEEPLYLTGEIVEIGAVKLDDRFQVVDGWKSYIRPQVYPRMHKRIASLTGISDRILAQEGVPFPEAFRAFQEWCGGEFAYMTWSMSDLPMLLDNMRLHGLDVSQVPACYDLQRIFGREILRDTARCSLDRALEILGETGEVAHDALHDARNTAKICGHLDLEEYLEEYTARTVPQNPTERVYETLGDMLEAEELKTLTCPWCGKTVTGEGWVSNGNHSYLSCGLCPEEDEFLLEIETIKLKNHTYRAKRMVYEMSDDLWEQYMNRKELLGV